LQIEMVGFASEEVGDGEEEEGVAGYDEEVADDDGEKVGEVSAEGDRDRSEEGEEVVKGEPVDAFDSFVEPGVGDGEGGVEGEEDYVLYM
jgi:hypothetical protein